MFKIFHEPSYIWNFLSFESYKTRKNLFKYLKKSFTLFATDSIINISYKFHCKIANCFQIISWTIPLITFLKSNGYKIEKHKFTPQTIGTRVTQWLYGTASNALLKKKTRVMVFTREYIPPNVSSVWWKL